MSPEEHLLVIAMLARQAEQIRALIEILESNGLRVKEDVTPFFEYQTRVPGAATLKMAKIYMEVATNIGLDLQLPDFEEQP